ncbi:ALQxL family class IV lanthipeptide [Actinacidiphila alni]
MELDLDSLQVLPADHETTSLQATTTCGGPTCGTGSTCGGETCMVSN